MRNFTIAHKTFKVVVMVLASLFIISCATQVEEKPTQPKKASVPFDKFQKVFLVKSKIADKYAEHPANIKAVTKVDELLTDRLGYAFSNFETISLEQANRIESNTSSPSNTLLIKPLVKQVKFIGGAARFWAGAMAGSSVIIIDVAFEDAANGDVIGEAGFYRKGNAHAGAWTMGAVDNQMLDQVAQDIVNYAVSNR